MAGIDGALEVGKISLFQALQLWIERHDDFDSDEKRRLLQDLYTADLSTDPIILRSLGLYERRIGSGYALRIETDQGLVKIQSEP